MFVGRVNRVAYEGIPGMFRFLKFEIFWGRRGGNAKFESV